MIHSFVESNAVKNTWPGSACFVKYSQLVLTKVLTIIGSETVCIAIFKSIVLLFLPPNILILDPTLAFSSLVGLSLVRLIPNKGNKFKNFSKLR